MTPVRIAEQLGQRFGNAVTESLPKDKHPRVHTTAEHWRAIAEFLRHDEAMAFDWLSCLTAVDYPQQEQLCAVYDLRSMRHHHRLAIKVYVSRSRPQIASVADLWATANWHEREAFDLMGLVFEGHPDLRRILLPEDWEGHPMRKDYQFPAEYQGIPVTVEQTTAPGK